MRIAVLPGLFFPGLLVGQPICQIQGSGASSPYLGQVVTTEGVVTAVFSGAGSLNGYFIEQPECDQDATTSNGIFVYDPAPGGVVIGLRLSLVATVAEFNGTTELIEPAWTVVGTGTVAPTTLSLPVASWLILERHEGMLVRLAGEMRVSDNTDWVQYGEVTLSPQRPLTPTNIIDPNDAVASGTTSTGAGNAAEVSAAFELHLRSTLKLDDGRTSSYPQPGPWADASGTLRCGSVITDLTGVLHYSFGDYKIEPVGEVQVSHHARTPPPAVGGSLRAAGLNVLNFYSTLGEGGAQNADELARQRTKLVAALATMDADVLALCELENTDAAWNNLLAALNAAMGAGTYSALEEDGIGPGTRMVILYKPAVLSPVTPLYSLSTSVFQRPHLTQGFLAQASGERFLFSTMHLRSKSCDNAEGADQDQSDGQGCYNALRRAQAAALLGHWQDLRATTGIDAQLILGDYNAYTEEDPLDLFRANGLVDLLGGTVHTYRFQGLFGALDHAFATPTMHQAITGAAPWHINADEPADLNYRDANISRYRPDPYRCSDHDPVLVGFDGSALGVGQRERVLEQDVRCWINGTQANWLLPAGLGSGARIQVFSSTGALLDETAAHAGATIALDLGRHPPGMMHWQLLSARAEWVVAGRFLVR